MEKQRWEATNIRERALGHFRSKFNILRNEVAKIDEKNYQAVNMEASNGLEYIPTFEFNKLTPSQVEEIKQWSRDRIEKLNATNVGLQETIMDLNTQVEDLKLELFKIRKHLLPSSSSSSSFTTVADIEKSLNKSSRKNTTYLKEEKDRLLRLRNGIEQCIQEAEELVKETCPNTLARSEQSITQLKKIGDTIQDGIENRLNEIFYSGAVNFDQHTELKGMLMES